jgi:ubiquinone/menaquinone biosynthesis C-methylase UbiE
MNCDRLAPWYRWAEYGAFGRALQGRRLRFLKTLRTPHRVLMVGEGDGRFLQALARQHPNAAIDYIDVSARMLALAQRRAPATAHIRFHHASALTEPLPGNSYDLVVTHFFLDCLTNEEVEALAKRVSEVSTATAQWLISEFRQPTTGLPALWARSWLSLLYRFFRISTGLRTTCLPDHHAALQRRGFSLTQSSLTWAGLLTSELWERDDRRLKNGD